MDHLERITEADISVLAENGTTAVVLPGAQMYLRDTSPPIESLREAGVPIAVGTDLNPGSSPVFNPWVTATLACVLQRLTVEEALLGVTKNAGRALGEPSLGWLGPGSVADLVVQPPQMKIQVLPGSFSQLVARKPWLSCRMERWCVPQTWRQLVGASNEGCTRACVGAVPVVREELKVSVITSSATRPLTTSLGPPLTADDIARGVQALSQQGRLSLEQHTTLNRWRRLTLPRSLELQSARAEGHLENIELGARLLESK